MWGLFLCITPLMTMIFLLREYSQRRGSYLDALQGVKDIITLSDIHHASDGACESTCHFENYLAQKFEQ